MDGKLRKKPTSPIRVAINEMKKTSILNAAATAAMTAAMIAGTIAPVFAETPYTAVNGTETTFTKYVLMNENANVPNATFNFTVVPGTAVEATKDTAKVYAGVGTPTIAPVIFSSADKVYKAAEKTEADKGLELGDYTAFAKQTATINFSGCSFAEPGIYRYVVTETATDNMGVTNDADATRTLDVYVTDDGTGTLKVASYVLQSATTDGVSTFAVATDGDALATKSYEYTNEYSTNKLTFKKVVDGNQASRDKYFKVDLHIEGAVAGTKLNVVGAGTTFDAAPAQNSATKYTADDMKTANTVADNQLVVGADGSVDHTFYLQNGQTVEIDGLAKGTKWAVTEAQEDYTPTATVAGDADAKVNATTNGAEDTATGITADTDVEMKNTKKGTIPTGVFMSFGGVAAVTLLGGAGFAMTRKKKRENEE